MTEAVPMPETSDVQMPEAAPNPPSKQRTWSMPKNPVTRQQVDETGRIALRVGAAIGRFVAEVARYGARVVRHLIRGIEAVPAILRVLVLLGLLILLGIVGSLALQNVLGLICIVVVVPVCSIALGALGHGWLSGLGGQRESVEQPAPPVTSELQRSVEYVDKKLTLALNSFGAERHQSAMIALFQAKTAVELTLGTEDTDVNQIDAFRSLDDHNPRPRIRAGSTSKSALRESTSLAAS